MVGEFPVVTLCGSTKFKNEFYEAQKRLTLEGNIVISVGLFGHSGDAEVWDGIDEGALSKTKMMLDEMHKRKIDMADSIYVVNVDGYIGDSTRSEIEYAKKHGKKVAYLVEPGTEPKHYLFEIRDYLEKNHIEYNADAISSIEERKNGKLFAMRDHIRAMVYALLTNQTVWSRIQPLLPSIDRIFNDYDAEYIKAQDPDNLAEELFYLKCGNMSTRKQMRALRGNIEVFERIQDEYGAVDKYIITHAPEDLVKAFSDVESDYKLGMMGEALVWEYLRNIGIDGVKPDTHIRRFLAGNRMGRADVPSPAPLSEVHSQVEQLSQRTGMLKAEIDNLIWSFCADGYGEICTAKPHCDRCPIKSKCAYVEWR